MRTAILVAVSVWTGVLIVLASLSPMQAGLQPAIYEPAFEVTLSPSPLEPDPPFPMPLPVPPVVPVHEEASPRSDEAPPVEVAVDPVQTMPESPAEIDPGLPRPLPLNPATADVAEMSEMVEIPVEMEMSVAIPTATPVAVPITASIISPNAGSLAAAITVDDVFPVGMQDPGLVATKAPGPRVPDNAPSADTLRRLDVAIAKRLKYPVQARKRGIQGTVVLSMAVDNAGKLILCVLEKTSGSKLLDEAGLKLLKGLFPFPGGFISAFQTRIAISYTLD